MLVHWQKSEVQRDIGYARVRLEDGKQAKQAGDNKEWLRLKPECQASNISHQMQPEYADEEVPE